MKILPFALLLSVSSSLSALLPPVWQDIAELKAIVNAPQLDQYLDSGDSIEGIDRAEAGWVIKTNKKSVFVDIISQPQEMPGPKRFDLKFHE